MWNSKFVKFQLNIVISKIVFVNLQIPNQSLVYEKKASFIQIYLHSQFHTHFGMKKELNWLIAKIGTSQKKYRKIMCVDEVDVVFGYSFHNQ